MRINAEWRSGPTHPLDRHAAGSPAFRQPHELLTLSSTRGPVWRAPKAVATSEHKQHLTLYADGALLPHTYVLDLVGAGISARAGRVRTWLAVEVVREHRRRVGGARSGRHELEVIVAELRREEHGIHR